MPGLAAPALTAESASGFRIENTVTDPKTNPESEPDQTVAVVSATAGSAAGHPEVASASNIDDSPAQGEMPFAVVHGEPYTSLPTDLYIPPDALEVFLEAFEGPLDLLLYLIRRQNLDILDIPIAQITEQYIEYIGLMQDIGIQLDDDDDGDDTDAAIDDDPNRLQPKFELAAEYLLMAAILAEIKSRMLLPRPKVEEGEEEIDPRADLVRRLQEYERYKKAAEDMDELPRMERDVHIGRAHVEHKAAVTVPPDVDMKELLLALRDVLKRAELFGEHAVTMEPLSVRERMSRVMSQLQSTPHTQFHQLFTPEEGRIGIVVTFLALLELLKERIIEVIQNEPLAPIYIKTMAGPVEASDRSSTNEEEE